MHHDDLIRRLRAAVAAVDPTAAADAFVASLGSAPLRYRSTLRSWACASLMPDHCYLDLNDCAVCGVSQTVDDDMAELVEMKEEGACYGTPDAKAWLVDLEHFQTLPPVRPNAQDREKLREIVTTAAELPDGSRAKAFVKALRGVIGKNASDREDIAETLAVCGVLAVRDHPAPATRWVSFWERQEMPNIQTDAGSPLAWWTAEEGIDADSRFFPELELSVVRRPLPPRSIDPDPVRVAGVRGVRPAMTLEPGDLLAITMDGRVHTAWVLGSTEDGNKRIPVLELGAVYYDQIPAPETARSASPRLVGRYAAGTPWRREPLAMEGLSLFGKAFHGTLDRIATRAPSPHPPPDHCRVVRERNVLYALSMLTGEAMLRTT